MTFLQDLLVLFGLGIFAVVIFHRVNLPPVLGFLLTGLLCGPYGFKLVDSIHEVEALAELGVVLLLFTIGIEFSFAKLKRMKKFLLVGGGLQVLLTVGGAAGAAMLFGLPWNVAVFVGMLIALSSTVLVVRLLQHQGEMASPQGSSAISILVFQDLCIVPMVLVTPFLGGGGADPMDLLWITGKAALFVLVAIFLARYLVPYLLDHVASTRKREAFVLSIMLLCLGTGWATSQVGLSLALGAFLAGLVISESNYSHQAFSEILPFREVFNFLVFVSIGMLFDARTLLAEPWLIAGGLLLLVLIKALVTTGVTFALGHSLRVALVTGFLLAQVSEFSFVLAKVGLHEKVWDEKLNQIFLAIAILSMAVTPLVTGLGSLLSDLFEKILPGRITGGRLKNPAAEEHMREHVIILGYGVSGRTLVRVLKAVGVPFVVIEQDPEVVSTERRAGLPILYGDGSSEAVLEHAGVARARLVAITTIDDRASVRATAAARRLNPQIHVIARARTTEELTPLVHAGAQEVVPEELVGSIEMFSRVLQNCLVPQTVVDHWVETIQREWAEAWQTLFEKLRPGDGLPGLPCKLRIEVHKVPLDSVVAGKSLAESHLRRSTGASVVAIQRGDGSVVRNPAGGVAILAGDTLILMGEPDQLAAAGVLISTLAPAPESQDPVSSRPVCRDSLIVPGEKAETELTHPDAQSHDLDSSGSESLQPGTGESGPGHSALRDAGPSAAPAADPTGDSSAAPDRAGGLDGQGDGGGQSCQTRPDSNPESGER